MIQRYKSEGLILMKQHIYSSNVLFDRAIAILTSINETSKTLYLGIYWANPFPNHIDYSLYACLC